MTQEEANTFFGTVEQTLVGDKYVRVDRAIVDGVDYKQDEYVCCCGTPGYSTTIYKTEDEKEYRCSKGYGMEADDRTFDWIEIQDEII
uniref:Uncharacterized protein n=1 Tax=uncultured marine virus TaxID=186617 RepID=A0A0F7L4G9_9VIRU|nr:hypothetical protein [uncultured marine virus]